jgi:phosphatidate cytidylyltransferase
MKGLRNRVLTAAVLLPLVLILIRLGPFALAPLLGLFAILGGREFVRLQRARGPAPSPWVVAGGAIVMIAAWGRIIPIGIPVAILAVAVVAIASEFSRPQGSMLSGLPIVISGSVYLGLFPAHLLGFYALGRRGIQDALPVYYALVLVWGCDTAAYLVGSAIGKHRLWPRVSPSKSWEGAIAGVLGSIALALALGGWIPGLGLTGRLGAGALVGVISQLGDLAESKMKREADLKDSGSALPGHGGVLDRLDSLILAAPILYYWVRWSVGFSS